MPTFSRYERNAVIAAGSQLGTARAVSDLRSAIKDGSVSIAKSIITVEADRLDNLAGTIYGDSRLWWVLAAASNIGWGLQVPPGTVINIVRITDVESFA